MSRSVLVVGGVVVVGAGIALAVMLAGGDDSSSTGAGTAKTPSGDPTSGTGGVSGVGGGPAGVGGTASPGSTTDLGPRPSLPAAGTTGSGGGPGVVFHNGQTTVPSEGPNGVKVTVRERGSTPTPPPGESYTVGAVRMRDHRGSGGAPVDIPPNVHTPEGPRIDSTLTAAIGSQVRTVIQTCAKDASREGRGAEPRVDGQIVITVSGGQATIISSVMQPRDISEAAASALKACIEPKLVGISSPAPDQSDLDRYGINITARLP